MLCEECHKNEACVTVLASINGKEVTRQLCTECMKKQGMNLLKGNLENFIATMLSQHIKPIPVQEKKREDLGKTCPGCGMKLLEYRKNGLLGCKECYHSFAGEIEEHIKSLYRRSVSLKQDSILDVRVEMLQEKMAEAVKNERYEEAARIRDELKSLTAVRGGKT